MSLRVKLVLALLLTGLAAVLTVGGVAYGELHRKFASLQAQQARQHFRAQVAAYLAQGGGWQPGRHGRELGEFIARQSRGEPDPRQEPRRPPPPREHGGRPPEEPGGRPQFRFILTDGDYRVLMGAGIYRDGEALPPAARAHAEPVEVDGRVQAYVSTEGVLSPGPQDQAYLAIMREALFYGAAGALALALLLGLLLGQGLSAPLRRLTGAVRAMRSGDLRQRVAPGGGAEVRSLALAFNEMSEALASSHEALRASHATISAQAVQLQELSLRDPLTGLHNRRHFDVTLGTLFEQSRRHGHALSLVVADIDWFKRINDHHSHAMGDAVLRQVAELMRTHLRASDLLARWGGEEFVIALPETPLPAAAALCEKLRTLIEQFPWSQLAADLRVTVSLGLSAEPALGSAAAMLAQADARLYQAKQSGRNRVVFA